MESLNQAPTLRCKLCQKLFNSEVTLKRHGYYCRKIRGEKRAHLPRSCLSCARSKVRCNKIAPRCSTCATKNLDCQYPSHSSPFSEAESQEMRAQRNTELDLLKSLNPTGLSASIDPQITEVSPAELRNQATYTLEFPDFQSEVFDWSSLRVSSDLKSTQDVCKSQDLENTNTGRLQHYVTANGLMSHAMKRLSDLTHPATNIRFLRTRPKFKTGAQMTANSMARILCSYPKMLMEHNTCPPFLHPQWVSACNSEESMEPLANCISLLAMLGTRSRGTASLFWRNARMECDRITSNHTSFNSYGLVATVQALLIYMLMRVAEGETEHNNHDAALLGTLTIVLGELRRRSSQYTSLEQDSLDMMCPGISWEQWIFQESRRRVAIVFRIINMLVCMSPATTCIGQPGLILAPLPARKQLWEAASEEQWLQELHRVPSVNGGFGLAESGDLIELDEYLTKSLSMPESVEACTSSKSKENWEDWCAGMDGFGALIMLAASLPL